MKILVADDDGVSRSMMKKMLLQSGYEVVTARDGREAVDGLLTEDGPKACAAGLDDAGAGRAGGMPGDSCELT